MARSKNSDEKKSPAQADAVWTLVGFGLLLAICPLLLGKSTFGSGMRPLVPIGAVMIAAGAVLWGWRRRDSGPSLNELPPPETWMIPLPSAAGPTGNDAGTTPWLPTQPPDEAFEPAAAGGAWDVAVFERIGPRRFEALVEAVFAQAGFGTHLQAGGASAGAVITVHSRSPPNTPVSVVLCWHPAGGRVGVAAVRALYGLMTAKNVRRGQLATRAAFTPEALTLANETGINLLDPAELLTLIAQRSEAQQAALLAVALR